MIDDHRTQGRCGVEQTAVHNKHTHIPSTHSCIAAAAAAAIPLAGGFWRSTPEACLTLLQCCCLLDRHDAYKQAHLSLLLLTAAQSLCIECLACTCPTFMQNECTCLVQQILNSGEDDQFKLLACLLQRRNRNGGHICCLLRLPVAETLLSCRKYTWTMYKGTRILQWYHVAETLLSSGSTRVRCERLGYL